MDFNPRHVPWMTILGVIGLAVGYLVGKTIGSDPMVVGIWGLVSGTVAGLLLRTILTFRWARRMKDKIDSD